MLIFSYYSCPIEKVIKFSINKTYKGKTWRVLSNQHLSEEQTESSNFVPLFSQMRKNGYSLFLPFGLQKFLPTSNSLLIKTSRRSIAPGICFVKGMTHTFPLSACICLFLYFRKRCFGVIKDLHRDIKN